MAERRSVSGVRPRFLSAHPAPQWGVAGVVVGFALLAVLCSLIVPLGEGVDEAAHFAFVDYLGTFRRLPVQEMHPGNPVIMGHHPPLYYALGAAIVGWADTSGLRDVIPPNPRFAWVEGADPGGWNVHLHSQREAFPYRGSAQAFHTLRLFSVAIGVVAVYVNSRIGRLLIPDRPWLVVAATALIAFNPGVIYSWSTVHHDALQSLNFALGLWWGFRYVRLGGRWGQWLLAGLLASAALMTKLSGLGLLASLGLALLVRSCRERDWRPVVLGGGVVLGLVALLTGWWYLRNLKLYGDLVGWELFKATYPHVLRRGPYNWFFFWNEFIAQLGRNFWGAFGYMHVLLPPVFRRVLWTLSLMGGVGLVVGLWRSRGWRPSAAQVDTFIVSLGTLIAVLTMFVRGSIQIMGWGHARYLFGVLAPIMVAVCLGLDALTWTRLQRMWGMVVPIGMLGYAVYAICFFVPCRYRFPPRAGASLSAAEPVGHLFENGVELVAYQWSPSPAPPGADATLCTYWRLGDWQGEDIRVRGTLHDRLGAQLGSNEDFWPVDNGFPPAGWQPDVVYVDCRTFYVPPNAYTGRSHVQLARLDPQTNGLLGETLPPPRLPVSIGRHVEGGELDDLVVIAQLGERISLVGFEQPPEARGGQDLEITLYWRADGEIAENHTVFVQVLDADGVLVAQKDSEPGNGQYPTSVWEPGQIVADPYAVPIPDALPSGSYRVIVGMYTLPSVERLPVRLGDEVVGDHVALSTVSVPGR